MEDFKGDRECPICEIESLVEEGSSKWRYLKCGEVFDEEWLDDTGE
jgi:transcription initiation factor TFIIIB Brf1 subunit/transcription initiation factor TFIIB